MTQSDATLDPLADGGPADCAWPLLLDDYPEAVIRIASLSAGGQHHLVLAWVELQPFDMSAPSSWVAGSKPWPVPRAKDWSCGFSATKVPTPAAIRWYHDACAGRVNIAPTRAAPIPGQPIRFAAEPAIGRFAAGAKAPFLRRWHDGPRVHRLVPLQNVPRVVRELGRSAEVRRWLEVHLGFDPFSFDEWLGSVALVAPDPLCCSVTLHPGPRAADGEETLGVQVTPRRSAARTADLSTAMLLVGERRAGAWTSMMPFRLEPTRRIIAFPQPLGEIGHALVCERRGPIRLVEPSPWLRQIKLNMMFGAGRAAIEVPSGGRRKPALTYEVSLRNSDSTSVVGEAATDAPAKRLIQLTSRRRGREKLARAPQHVFGCHDHAAPASRDVEAARKRAHEFVLDLVRRATRRLIFVDPYFGLREVRDLALRNENPAVVARVLTGQPGLRANTGDVPGFQVQAGLALVMDLRGLRTHYGRRTPVVRVMPGGNTPDIHDRFLVVDDEVWHCGPSFNESGERAGVIVRLPNPLEIRRMISRIWVRSQPIEALAPAVDVGQKPA